MASDPHRGPVPASAWAADAAARTRGRVEMFNASRPGGLDRWTMDERQYAMVRDLFLELVDAAPDGVIRLSDVVDAAQDRLATHPLFPGGRLRNCCTFTKVDLQARCELERVLGSGAQRLRRWQGAVPEPPPG